MAANSRPSAIGAVDDQAARTSLLSLGKKIRAIQKATDVTFLAAIKLALAGTFVAVPTTWTALTLINSWVNFDAGHPAQIRKVGDDVEVRGLIKSGVSGTVAFNAPAGSRPFQTDETFPIVTSPSVFGLISINGSTGAATVTGSTTFVYLSGIRYSTVA